MSEFQQILDRIEVASPESPISVFASKFSVFAVFGRTVETDRWIREGKNDVGFIHHVGTFDSTYNPTTVKRLLREAQSMLN